MLLSDITPVLLTYNESPNIGRTLERLAWARDIVIVDSFSEDDTLAIAGRYPQVRIFQRRFDEHALQWNFAVRETGIRTPWVWALDADYVLSPELVAELERVEPAAETVGFETRFRYCIYGETLRGSVYPAKVTLFRRDRGHFEQDGHTQRLAIAGPVAALKGTISHDDRKSLARWLGSQAGYMRREAVKLTCAASGSLSAADRLRNTIVLGPLVMFFYCLFWKKNILDGQAGLYYTIQRTLAELILSAYLLEQRLRGDTPRTSAQASNREELS
ncbi:MAG TPA: glycosyltransferase family 2 protein [Burkholderiales bacterium]|nr:glycosyltransferase family 2 protein [Burkholderiales bacterium]